tara:strand:- start:386 stop:619 length:234 start_codon:yes stop_codon:yes gene_type:complete
MELRVGSLQGNSPNFRVTIDDTLIVRGDFNLSQQQYMPVPFGTQTQRPAVSAEGSLYWNTTDTKMQIYANSEWRNIG